MALQPGLKDFRTGWFLPEHYGALGLAYDGAMKKAVEEWFQGELDVMDPRRYLLIGIEAINEAEVVFTHLVPRWMETGNLDQRSDTIWAIDDSDDTFGRIAVVAAFKHRCKTPPPFLGMLG